jgi:hypothetical protein
MSLNFFIPISLQSSGSATMISGCLPIWNLLHTSLKFSLFFNSKFVSSLTEFQRFTILTKGL